MSNILSNVKMRNMTISAVVTRADGTVEDRGVVCYKNSNPFKTFGWYLMHPEQWRHKAYKSYLAFRRLLPW